MTIPTLPAVPWVTSAFTLEEMSELDPLRSGDVLALDIGPNKWHARLTSGPLERGNTGIVRAWHDAIQSKRPFYCYDTLNQWPLEYAPQGPWPFSPAFDGTVLLTAVDTDFQTITLEDTPVGLILSPGDYGAFDANGGRQLFRVQEGGISLGSGLVVKVGPDIRPDWNLTSLGTPTVQLWRAAAKMLILPGSWDESTQGSGDVTTFSFEAIESPYA